MTDTNRPPLWRVMQDAVVAAPTPAESPAGTTAAAQIRAVRDWIQAELATDYDDEGWEPANLIELPDLKVLLTAEADRAERGDHD